MMRMRYYSGVATVAFRDADRWFWSLAGLGGCEGLVSSVDDEELMVSGLQVTLRS
jgi:hypothetical protein